MFLSSHCNGRGAAVGLIRCLTGPDEGAELNLNCNISVISDQNWMNFIPLCRATLYLHYVQISRKSVQPFTSNEHFSRDGVKKIDEELTGPDEGAGLIDLDSARRPR